MSSWAGLPQRVAKYPSSISWAGRTRISPRRGPASGVRVAPSAAPREDRGRDQDASARTSRRRLDCLRTAAPAARLDAAAESLDLGCRRPARYAEVEAYARWSKRLGRGR